MAGEGRHFKLSPITKKIVLIVSLLLIIDVLLVVFGGPFLSERIWFFSGKSATHMLSDLLFLEGGVIFAAGVFLFLVAEFRPRQHSKGILLTIAGASLIGLSIALGALLL